MREILFRGKSLKNGEFVEGHYFKNDSGTFIFTFPYHANYADIDIMVKADPETVGQYTGLTDKNGTKIFEGDIIKVPNWECYGAVKYNVPECAFYIEMSNGDYVPTYDYSSEVEIIGNIYDNPELITR